MNNKKYKTAKKLTFVRNKEREEFYENYFILYRHLYSIVNKTMDDQCRLTIGQKILNTVENMWGCFVLGASQSNMNSIKESYKYFEVLRTQIRLLLDENVISSGHHQILIERLHSIRKIFLNYLYVYTK